MLELAIASNVAQTSTASNEVARNITGIAQAAGLGAEDAGKVSRLAAELEILSGGLAAIVRKFKTS